MVQTRRITLRIDENLYSRLERLQGHIDHVFISKDIGKKSTLSTAAKAAMLEGLHYIEKQIKVLTDHAEGEQLPGNHFSVDELNARQRVSGTFEPDKI